MDGEQAIRENFEAANRRNAVGRAFGDSTTARGRESGGQLERDGTWVYWMRPGKIVRVEIDEDVTVARAVAGVRP